MYESYWSILEKSIEWMDTLDEQIEVCKSCQTLDFLERDCGHFLSIMNHILDNPPFLMKLFHGKDYDKVRKYIDSRVKSMTIAFNKKRIVLHIKKIV